VTALKVPSLSCHIVLKEVVIGRENVYRQFPFGLGNDTRIYS
jgi:hypothetical protein